MKHDAGKETDMGRQRGGKEAEGPAPGSEEMQDLVSEAEDNAEDNTADQAGREQDQQMQQGTENTS
jgi:hypothetical protein